MTDFQPKLGTWYTLTFAHSGHSLSIEAASTAQHANAVQAALEGELGGDHQQWSFRLVEAGWYVLSPRHSDKVLEAREGGSNVHLATRDGGTNQQWRIADVNGGIQLFARHDGKAINVSPDRTQSGDNVNHYGTNNLINRRLQVEEVPAAFVPKPDTWYRLCFAHSGQALTVAGASKDNGANVVQSPPEDPIGGTHQQWSFEAVDEGWYVVRARHSQKLLAVEGSSTENGANIRQTRVKTENHNRHFKPITVRGGIVLKSRVAGRLLDVAGNSTQEGANVHQYGTVNKDNRRLEVLEIPPPFVPEADAWYVMRFAHSGHALSVTNAGTDNGASVIQAKCEGRFGGPHQQWSFEEVESGWYVVRARHSGKALDVSGNSQDNYADIHQWSVHSNANQQWKLTAVPGGVMLHARHSGKTLDVRSQNTASGANVIQYNAADGAHRRVLIDKLPSVGAFEPDPGAWYTLSFAHSGKALAGDGQPGIGEQLCQTLNHEAARQQWCFEPVEGDWYRIRNRSDNRLVDVLPYEGVHAINDMDDRLNQQWKLVPADDTYQLVSRHNNKTLTVDGDSLARVEGTSEHQSQRIHVRRVAGAQPTVEPRGCQFKPGDEPIRLPPLRVRQPFALDTSIELWARAAAEGDHEALIWIGNDRRALAIQHDGSNLIVKIRDANGPKNLLVAEGALPKYQWKHLALTVRSYMGTQDGHLRRLFSVKLYVDGDESASMTVASAQGSGILLRSLMNQPLMTECAIGGNSSGSGVFDGRLAEVRVWRTRRSSEEIERAYRQRTRGDEEDLVACYRLDHAAGERVLDHGPDRKHALVGEGLDFGEVGALPLAPTIGESAEQLGSVHATTRLSRAWLPTSALTESILAKLDGIAAMVDKDSISVSDLGPVASGRVQASIYEVVLEPRDPGGATRANSRIELSFGARQVVIIDSPFGDEPWLETWSAGPRVLHVPTSGRIRLRFIVDGLASAGIWVRHAGMSAGVWTAVRPDAHNFDALRSLDAETLLNPGGGRSSPLPEGTSNDDAAEVLTTLRDLARPGVPYEDLVGAPSGGNGGSVLNFFEKLGEDLVEIAEDAVDDIEEEAKKVLDQSEVVWAGTVEVANLIAGEAQGLYDELEAAEDVLVRQGSKAIVRGIASAEQMAIAATDLEEFINVIQIVGKSIIDGVTVYWRIVVDTIEDAAVAMGATFKRLGGEFKTFVDNLSALFDFDWGEALERSDEIYAEILSAFDRGAEGLGTNPFSALGDELDRIRASSQLDRSLLDLSGLDRIKPPKLGEFDTVMDYLGRAFNSARLEIDFPSIELELAAVDDLLDTLRSKIPIDLILDPSKIFSEPIRPVIEFGLDMFEHVLDALDAAFDTISEVLGVVIRSIEAFLDARLKLPWVTDIVEDTILSADGKSRRFCVLRMISLAVAIPAAFGGGQGNTGPSKGLVDAAFGMGVVNWVISTLRSFKMPDQIASALSMLQGGTLITQGMLEGAVGGELSPDDPEQSSYVAAAALNSLYGLTTLALGYYSLKEPNSSAWTPLSMTRDIVFGSVWLVVGGGALADAVYWPTTWVVSGALAGLDAYYDDDDKPDAAEKAELALLAGGVTLNFTYMLLDAQDDI